MLLVCLMLVTICSEIRVSASKIEDQVNGYFEQGHHKEFQNMWYKYRISLEETIKKTLTETFGVPDSMNVYVQREHNPQHLTKGFYIDDSVNSILLRNLYLREYPRMLLPDISFALNHNVLRIDAVLTNVFMDAEYDLYRNFSEQVYDAKAIKDPSNHSPFSFQDVLTKGRVMLIGQDCHLLGQLVVKLSGVSIHAGYDNLKVKFCKFSIEVSNDGRFGPPVIAPYLSKEQGEQLEELLSKPLKAELHAQLEGQLISFVDTAQLFLSNMPKFRRFQKYIFQDVFDFMSLVTREMNKEVMKDNQGIMSMEDMELSYSDQQGENYTNIKIWDVRVIGLERLYYSQRGGPIFTGVAQILDELRFAKLQVRGKCKMNLLPKDYDFVLELKDVAIHVKINMPAILKKNTRRNNKVVDDNKTGYVAISNEGTNIKKIKLEAEEAEGIQNRNEPDEKPNNENDDGYRDGDVSKYDDRPRDDKDVKRSVISFEVRGWHDIEFTSLDDSLYPIQNDYHLYDFITGYIHNVLPKTITENLKTKFEQIVKDADKIREKTETLKKKEAKNLKPKKQKKQKSTGK